MESLEWADVIQTLIVALIGTGGAALVWTVTQSLIAWRNSADAREDRAVARLERFEDECQRDLRWERKVGGYWCAWAGQLEYTMRRNGVRMPPKPPFPVRDDTEVLRDG